MKSGEVVDPRPRRRIELKRGRRPPTPTVTGILITPVDTADPPSTTTPEETLPDVVPSGESTYTTGDPPVQRPLSSRDGLSRTGPFGGGGWWQDNVTSWGRVKTGLTPLQPGHPFDVRNGFQH